MFLSLFFSVTTALVTTLIQKWTGEYLQYSQPSATPHTRGRVRAYLFDGLSRFQMRRLTDGVPVLLHLAIFLFLYALSEWLNSINVHVGTTARYCLVALLTVYIALSTLPLIVLNAPYQTALTTLLQACLSLIHISYFVVRRLVRFSSPVHIIFALFKSVHVDRPRALMTEIKKRAPKLDRSAMRWLLQEIDEDDMDTFLSGLPGYIHSPLTDTKLVVAGLREDGLPRRIRDRITICVTSTGLSQYESLSRAWACIISLRSIFETADDTAVEQQDDIRAMMEYLEPLCFNPSTALRASCIRSLVIRELLISFVDLDAEELLRKTFPDYLTLLYRAIRVWKGTEISQWPHLGNIITATTNLNPPPNDREMWTDVVYDGPLINLAVLAFALLSRANEGDVDLDVSWMIGILSTALGLTQLRASAKARARFNEVLLLVRGRVSGCEGGGAQIATLLKVLDTVISGLHLAEVFAYTPKPVLLPRQVEAIFGPAQLRDNELLEAFAKRLPGFISASTPEVSKDYMERLILEDKLWEQLHVVLLKCFDPMFPFPDKLRIIVAFFNIFDVAFDVLKDPESTIIDWRSPDVTLLLGHIGGFETGVASVESNNKVVYFHSVLFRGQFCHALLSQFAMRHSRGEPLLLEFLNSLATLVRLLGVGTQEDMDSLTLGNPEGARTGFDMMIKAGAILNVALRDGPLSNFCILGRLSFDIMAPDVSDLTSNDTKKLWKTLERMLDTSPASFVNSSEAVWARFDHLCALVCDPGLSRDNIRIVEKLQPLLDMIEKIGRMRPSGDGRDEGTGSRNNETSSDGSANGETRQSSEHLGTYHFKRFRDRESSLLSDCARYQRRIGSSDIPYLVRLLPATIYLCKSIPSLG